MVMVMMVVVVMMMIIMMTTTMVMVMMYLLPLPRIEPSSQQLSHRIDWTIPATLCGRV